MRKVSLRKFRANMAEELNNAPFILTRKGSGDYTVCVHKEKVCTQNPIKPCTQTPKRVHTQNDAFFRPHTKEHQARKKGK